MAKISLILGEIYLSCRSLLQTQKFFLILVLFMSLPLVGCGREHGSSESYFPGNMLGASLPAGVLSLTYDDGPSEATLPMARWLATRQIRATFFVIGSKIPGHEDVLQELKDLGHLVANHTYSHKLLTKLSSDEVLGEIEKTHGLIAPYVDQEHFVFRAPYGGWSSTLSALLNGSGLSFYAGNIFWDIGGEMSGGYAADWACWRDQLAVVDCGKRYEAEVLARGKGIVLMHDITAQTAAMTRFLIPRLEEKGYQFVRVDEVPRIAEALGSQQGNIL